MPHKTITYIALMRAINVGGHVVTMERLRGLFSELGFTNVRSYIQTGNVFFDTYEADRTSLTGRIQDHLQRELGYAVPTMLRTVDEVKAALNLEPFKDVKVTLAVRLCIAFLSEPLPDSLVLPHISPRKDFEILSSTQGEAFVVLRLIEGSPGNLTAYLEKNFNLNATVRFFATTQKILEAAEKRP